MKNLIKLLTAILVTTCLLCSCSKDSEKNTPIIKKRSLEELNRYQIDRISEEVSLFHDEVINKFLDTLDYINIGAGSDYLTILYNLICEEWSNYPFETMNNAISCSTYMSFETFYEIIDILIHNNSFSSNTITTAYNNDFPINCAVVDNFMDYANQSLEESFDENNNFDDFFNSYYTKIAARINVAGNNYDYLCMKIYSDMLMSSFQTWCNYLYSEEIDNQQLNKATEKPKDNRSWWQKAKDKAGEIWNEVKPIVACDAGGGVAGAIVGAAAAGVGAGPGAATGAIGASAGKCVENIINSL